MRLVAQRVRAPAGREGINAFCYHHGPRVWLDRAPAEVVETPGRLMNAHVEVPPPGNRVRSFLDITTPDTTPNAQVENDVSSCIDLVEDNPFPLDMHSGDTTFQFNLELALAPAWRRELLVLLHRALEVRV